MKLNQDKTVGYWFNEKKSLNCNIREIEDSCRENNINLIKINLNTRLDDQGPFDLIFHKLTYLYALAENEDLQARQYISMFTDYSVRHPSMVMMDPLETTRQLLLRDETYLALQSTTESNEIISTPSFVKVTATTPEGIEKQLKENKVTFPIVCKPICGGGGKAAHNLCVVFKKEDIINFGVPCIAQSFVNHSAVLYKLYFVGHNFFTDLRPSLRNFSPGDLNPVYFNSHQVSKSYSCSPLTDISFHNSDITITPDPNIFQRIVTMIRERFKMDLAGIDVVIEQETGTYYIIDVNPFPGYDCVPEFSKLLTNLFLERIKHGVEKDYSKKCEHKESLDKKHLAAKLMDHLTARRAKSLHSSQQNGDINQKEINDKLNSANVVKIYNDDTKKDKNESSNLVSMNNTEVPKCLLNGKEKTNFTLIENDCVETMTSKDTIHCAKVDYNGINNHFYHTNSIDDHSK